jgi:endonuclease/exonuclease/phosphatase family metal-dependent hydrolase
MIGLLATAALSLGCGASSLAHLAGFRSAEREPISTWTARVELAAEGDARLLPASAEGLRQGQFTLLTYNVAGLPEMFSPSSPRRHIPLVGPLLNRYDVAVVQEDFSYHRELIQATLHPFRSRPMRPRSFVGDGLNQFSRFDFSSVHRVRWEHCNGIVAHATDCLADKGFTFSDLRLAPGVNVHLYNLHADAGSGSLDIEARSQNFDQLSRYIAEHSLSQALIVAGDTNLRTAHHRGDARTLATFVERLGLTNACEPQVTPEEQIDRVLYRNSPELELSAPRCWNDRGFVDGQGEDLSDHPAIGVSLSWRRVQPDQLVAQRAEP